ncbi:MAG TPA: hypothetical protein V6D47_09835 [Oscillatoriaceae cyanobacterium]
MPAQTARGPYDFERSFRRIVCAVVATRYPEMGLRAEPLADGEFTLAIRIKGEPLLLALRQAADGAVQPRLLTGRLKAQDRPAVLAELRRILCLDHDLEAFYATVANDPALARLTRRYRGLRLVLTPTGYQGLVHAILFQQISYAAAQTVENRLTERWGERLAYGDRHFSLFPTPQCLAGLDVETLRSIGIPPRKARAVIQVSREVAAGALDLEGLAAHSDAERVARRLESIFGVGPWTAHHVIIRALGMTDCLPTEDPGLRRAVAEQYGLAEVGAEQLRQLAERWRPWRSYATYYLWNTFWE